MIELLYLPAIICFIVPILHAVYRASAEERRKREADAARIARKEAIAAQKAQREAEKAEEAAEAPKRKRGRPRKEQPAPELEQPAPELEQPAPERRFDASCLRGDAFAGQIVAFTGTLPGMTRAEAIQAVVRSGGSASCDMPASTTILVVGENPGKGKLDKAEAYFRTVRVIEAAEFLATLRKQWTFTPDVFAAFVATVR